MQFLILMGIVDGIVDGIELTSIVDAWKLSSGNLYMHVHLLDTTRNSCEKCNFIGPWQESNLQP